MRRSEGEQISTCIALQGIAKVAATDLMRLSRLRFDVFLITLLALLLPSLASGQTATSVNNSESTPQPGVGHDYLHFLSETVNPANGSLSVGIQFPVPTSRSFSIPFSVAYGSNGNFHIQDTNPPGGVYGATDASYVSSNGWSYSAPLLSYYNTYNSAKWKVQNGIQIYSTCEYLGDFIFADPSGGRHSLYLAYLLPNQTNFCNQATTPTSSYLSDTGVEGGYQAYMVIANGSSGQVYVASPDGTVYVFQVNTFNMPGLNGDGTPAGPPAAAYSLPSIEDRNGNLTTVVASGPNTNYDATDTPIWFPLAYTDSAGRTAVSTSGFGANGNTITVSGISSPYTVNWGTNPFSDSPSYTLGTQKIDTLSACPTSLADPAAGSGSGVSAVTSITLPNGHSYQILYDSTSGRVGKIIYPTGGWVQYVWGPNRLSDVVMFPSSQVNPVTGPLCEDRYDTVAVIHRYVSYDGTTIALQQDFSYSTTWDTSAPFIWDSKQTTVTTHDLVAGITYQTVYNYSSGNQPTPPNDHSSFAAQIPLEQSIVYKAPNGSVLRTVNKVWASLSLLGSECETLDNNLSSGTFYTYSASSQITDKKEYDYGTVRSGGCALPSSPPTREIVTNYASFSITPIYANAPSIFDRPSSVITKDSNGNNVAETDYSYDQTSVASASAVEHDETNYGASSTAPRGNATTVTRKCFGCTNTVTTYTYDETGQTASVKDPNGNTTLYSHADNYASGTGTPPGSTDAYLTQVTYPSTSSVAHVVSFSYGFNDGQVRSSTSENSQTTTYSYTDSLDRLTETDYPDGGQTLISYNDTPPTPSITTEKLIRSGQYITMVNVMDGMGHVTDSELTSDPQGVDYTVTSYDGLGHPHTVTNPYRSTSDPTYGSTEYLYDALGRKCLEIPPDGTAESSCPSTPPAGDVFTQYSANCTTVTDEAGKNRESCSDALGRLTSVIENPGVLNYATNYTYDALDNLLSVAQGTQQFCQIGAIWYSRCFTYNSLSQLTHATNPESGTVSYTYDPNGNVATKTDARGITTTYTHDALNRVTLMAYSNGDRSIGYAYDQSACLGQPACYNIGHRTRIDDVGGAEVFAYDKMGREIAEERFTGTASKTTSYAYDLAGDMTSLTYPSGRTITYTYDSAGRPSDAQDIANNINYAIGTCQNGISSTGVCYAPNGAVTQVKNGANLVSTYIYNKRFQPCWMYGTTGTALATTTTCTAGDPGPGNILDLQYNFNLGAGDNGNVVGITNKRDSTRTQSFTYDQLNRVVTAKTSATSGSNCWGETYTIDEWANLTAIGAVSGYTGCTQENLSVTATTKNQLSSTGFSYDTSGNMLNDGAHAYAYNAESEIKSAAGVNYTYDGDGNRIEKSSGKAYWYGAGTEVLDESDLSGNITNEYVFFGGKRIAMRNVSSGTIYYYEDDMLGSARTMVQAGQTSPCYDGDFYPFGGERIVTNTCTQNYKFEGKERDTETGNDDFGARYYTSRLGRWLSADWSAVPAPVPYANLTNPQTLNLYAMVSDNPETFADLDGHTAASISIDVMNSAIGGACGVTAEDASSSDKMCLLNLQSYWNDTREQTQANEANNESTQKGSTPPPKKAQQQSTIPGSTQPPALQPPQPPANAMQPTEFKTADAAGIEAEQRINPISQTEKTEYAGWIVTNPDGTYSIGAPRAGTPVTSDPGPEPSSAAADYHTHPVVPGYDNQHFSPQDKAGNRQEHLPGYLGTPTRILKYDPVTNRVTVLRKDGN